MEKEKPFNFIAISFFFYFLLITSPLKLEKIFALKS